MIGTIVSHYRILEKIGEGGMGEVYLAEDLKLRRRVALKILPEQLTRSAERKQRFVQEARAAAAIEHPHIAAIYDIDEVEGRTFIAMEYVRGQSLRQLLRSEKLTLARCLELAIQVAEALAKVHDRGVVHRDLKPENILVSEEGYPKIIDFGLAKLVEPLAAETGEDQSQLTTDTRLKTRDGQVMGTVAYMSPEQARGRTLDQRSDIFSFGVLLYEMLSGETPFKRASAIETLSAILRDTPPPVRVETRKAPVELHRVLHKALAKDPAARYETMRELAGDLRTLRDHMVRRPVAIAWSMVAAGLVLMVFLLAGIWWLTRRAPPAKLEEPREPLSVLIADFKNRTGDPVFDGALEQALSIALEGASFISSYPRPQARQRAGDLDPEFWRSSALGGTGGRLDEERAQLVCRSEGVKMVIAGSIEPSGTGYVIKASAYDAVSSETAAEASTRADAKADVLKAADNLAAELRSELGDTSPAAAPALAGETFTAASLEAMNGYARAQELLWQGKYEQAVAEYRKVIEKDPNLGRAYSGLAVLFFNQGEPEQALKYFQEALARIDRMSDREKYRTRGVYYLAIRNHEKAIEELSALVRLYPADTASHGNLATAYFYSRDMKKALEQGRRAIDLYPRNVPYRTNVALYAMYAADFETAESEALKVLELNASFFPAYAPLALSQLALGRAREAAETYSRLEKLSPRGASFAAVGQADIALYEGRLAEAETILKKGIVADLTNEYGEGAANKLVTLAQLHLLRGNTAASIQAADKAGAGSKLESVLFPAARIYLEGGREDKALALGSELAVRLQSDPQAYAKLIEGEVQLKLGNAREAIEKFQEARELADTWLGRFDLGRAYLEAGAFAEAYSEFELCLKRRGEATAVFLDDVPSYHYMPPVYYYLGRAQEGLKSPAAAESYRTFLAIKEKGGKTPLVDDARRRLELLK